jgi:hypothetical protein
LVVASEADAGVTKYFALDTRYALAQLVRMGHGAPDLRIPRAYELDDFTYGLLWATAALDDSLLADDVALADKRNDIGAYDALPGSAVSREIAADLTPASQMWLGSDFCARHILRNLVRPFFSPVFWTREQRGDEICSCFCFATSSPICVQ